MQLREYQQECLDYILSFNQGYKGLVIAPTGTGKSVMLSSVVANLNAKWLILQPTKEILEQNVEKLSKVFDVNQIGVYSASKNLKELNKQITVATPLSVKKDLNNFKGYNVIVDEAHLVNFNSGVYKQIITELKPSYLIGYTATPYRMEVVGDYCQARIMLNERNNFFKNEPWLMQPKTAFESRYLHKLTFDDSIKINGYRSSIKLSSSADFKEEEIIRINKEVGLYDKLGVVLQSLERKHKKILVFLTSIEECTQLASELKAKYKLDVGALHGNLKKEERVNLINNFKSGALTIMLNVGILTTGFDMPELDAILMARPTRSLILYAQIIGRVTRNAPNKKQAVVYDMVGNYEALGNPAVWEFVKNGKYWSLLSGNKQLVKPVGLPEGVDFADAVPTQVYYKLAGRSLRSLNLKDLNCVLYSLRKNEYNIKSKSIKNFNYDDFREKINKLIAYKNSIW